MCGADCVVSCGIVKKIGEIAVTYASDGPRCLQLIRFAVFKISPEAESRQETSIDVKVS